MANLAASQAQATEFGLTEFLEVCGFSEAYIQGDKGTHSLTKGVCANMNKQQPQQQLPSTLVLLHPERAVIISVIITCFLWLPSCQTHCLLSIFAALFWLCCVCVHQQLTTRIQKTTTTQKQSKKGVRVSSTFFFTQHTCGLRCLSPPPAFNRPAGHPATAVVVVCEL